MWEELEARYEALISLTTRTDCEESELDELVDRLADRPLLNAEDTEKLKRYAMMMAANISQAINKPALAPFENTATVLDAAFWHRVAVATGFDAMDEADDDFWRSTNG